MEKKDLIVIGGPTASGKTSLAVKIAAELSAEIVSADSRQIYRKMDIGTGKDLCEYNTGTISVPFHCIDIRNPEEDFTLHDYIKESSRAIKNIRQRKKLPVLAGGTGLYIESVVKQYNLPDIPPDYILRKKLEEKKKDEITAMLEKINPEIYRKTDLSSNKRIIRAIEKAVYLENNPYEQKSAERININPVVIITRWDRKTLTARIEKRLDERIKEGMIDEVKSLLDDGISYERLVSFGMEYKWITEYITGNVSFEMMKEKLFTDIRKLSKRQICWFRGMEKRGIEINYTDNADFSNAMEIINKYELCF